MVNASSLLLPSSMRDLASCIGDDTVRVACATPSSMLTVSRTLSSGQRGEVYEINGDHVAVIFDPSSEKLHDDDKDETCKGENVKPSIHWVDDSSQWLSRAVPKSDRREFIEMVDEMFDQVTGPVVKICGQNILAAVPKDKDKEPPALMFQNISRLSSLAVLSETRTQQAASMTEFNWLGRRSPITSAKTRVSILKG